MNKVIAYFSVFLAIVSSSCKKGNNPVEVGQESRFFYGHVVDNIGDPIGGVGIHYIFDTEPFSIFQKIAKACPSTPIHYQLPGPVHGHVTMTLFRWYTHEFIAKVFDDTTGIIDVNWDSFKITNGIYIIHFVEDTVVQDLMCEISDVDYSSLAAKTPLAVTDSSGNFSLPYGIFAFGVPLVQSRWDNTVDTAYVSTDIDFVLHTPTGQTFNRSIEIDTTKDTYQEFHLGQ